MAHIDVTKNKNGRLQAKIMFYGKDAVTQKTKLLSRRIYNDDNLTEAKFRRYAEKVLNYDEVLNELKIYVKTYKGHPNAKKKRKK